MRKSEFPADMLADRARLVDAMRHRGWSLEPVEALFDADVDLEPDFVAEKRTFTTALRFELSFRDNRVCIVRSEHGVEASARLTLKLSAGHLIDLLSMVPDTALSPGGEDWLAKLSLLSSELWLDTPDGTKQLF